MKSNSLWAIIILGGFIGLFFWLRTIDWVGMFDIEKHTRDTEEKLGDLFWEHLGDEGNQITDSLGKQIKRRTSHTHSPHTYTHAHRHGTSHTAAGSR
jgi:hypothetical protein